MATKTSRPVGSIRSTGESVFDLAPAQAKRLKGLMKAHLAESQRPASGTAKRKASPKRRSPAA
jgi:hypothetical protein